MPKVSDPLCPLGFHPQVRWPTRCKRCFREYKEHSNATNRKDNGDSFTSSLRREDRSSSVDSLDDSKFENIATPVVPVRTRESVALNRRNTTEIPMLKENPNDASGESKSPKSEKETEKSKDYSSIYSSISGSAFSRLNKHRSSAAAQEPSGTGAIAKSSGDFEIPRRGSSGDESERLRRKRVQIHSLKEVPADSNYSSPDVQFILEVKRSNIKSRGSDDDANSFAGTDITENTETTETTLVEANFDELQDQVNNMKKEIDKYRARCERLEREKDELSNKKFRSIGMNGGTGSESMRLQQKIRELETSNEDLLDDKQSAELRVAELERELESRPSSAQTHKAMEEIRAKSAAAEALIEELMEENEELKKDMRLMVDEMDELQDNFREDQADEYRDLKKDLEQTAKNCRILQFKLRKAERRMEQLETDKHELELQNQEFRNNSSPSIAGPTTAKGQDRISQLEQELNQTREQLALSQREVQKLQSQIRTGSKDVSSLSGPVLSKSRSLEGAGSATTKSTEDVSQLQRDLQDSLEREADLREQLKFAEEEAQSLRKKLSRIEEENESLVMQLKKMAMKKGQRTAPNSSVDKDEGISGDIDDLSLSELRLQLELNEQETAVLRRKMEDMEGENDRLSKEVLELQELVKTKPTNSSDKTAEARSKVSKPSSEEINKLKTELMEKNKEIEHLNEALTQAEKNKGKIVVQRSRSLESSESALDLKRQLQLVEQEAGILRSKTVELETENEKMTAENRRLHLRVSRKPPPSDAEKLLIDKLELEERIKNMEKKLTEAASPKQHGDPEKSPRLGRASDRGARLSTGSINPESSVLKREKEILERDLKSKEEQINSLTLRLQHMEKENENLHHRMDTRVAAVKRIPKKPSETMTKVQLKKMVEDLEIEITDFISRSTAQPLPSDTKKIAELTKNLKEEREQRENLVTDKKKLDEKMAKLEMDIKKGNSSAIQTLQEKCDKLEKEKTELAAKMQAGDFVDLDTLHQVKQEKHKLQKELTERDNRLSELEKKIRESEDKNRKLERTLKDNNERIIDVEREIEEERSKLRQTESSQKELSLNWLKERDELKKQMTDMRSKMDELESAIVVKDKKIKDLDTSLKDEAKKAADTALKKSEREIKLAKEETTNFKTKAEDMEQKFTRAEMDKKGLNERIQRLEADWRKERDQLIGRATDLEVEIKAERKKKDRVEKEYEGEMREKDDEVMGLKERIKRTEIELKAALERYEELKNQDTRSRELELELEREHQEYEDLTAKYDLLEEDYLVIKAKLVMDKQNIEREYLSLKKEHDTVEGELRTLRETFNLRQDTWIKEKLDMQEKMKEFEEKELRHTGENWYIERSRLKDIIEEKNQQLEKTKRDEEMHRDHIDNIRRENDELRRKLEDFDKVTKIKRSMTYDSSEHEREMRELKNRLAQEEKSHRSEMTHAKMRHDNKVALLQEETQATQMQLEKARRERDTFREMLDGAQRMISELKSDPSKKTKSGSDAARSREMEDTLTRIEEFHAQITSLEDELNEARTETSRIKTEYLNEKSAKEIKISELQTKINELEEDKIMAMGRSRITGTRTRLELAWQKEREEQQRLIQESSTLARDLRQTLLEVEKERDRERLESRRRLEQQKRANEEEQVEIRKKVTELQSDLLELRDAHAKLRTSCEKLRRDKERVEKERDDVKKTVVDSRKAENDTERRVSQLVAEIQKMKDLCPLAMGESLSGEVPSGAKRDKDVRQEKIREEFLTTLRLINQCSEDVKKFQQRDGEDINKRATTFRRAMSNAPGDMGSNITSNNYGDSVTPVTPVTKRAPVYRRALSLEQSQNIREIENTSSSSHTSNSYVDNEPPYSSYRSRTVDRDISLDRQSTDSTHSESAVMATPETKKKRSLMGKIKQLTKSRSIEDTGTANQLVNAGIQALIPSVSVAPSGSDLSLDKDPDRKKEKKTVKDKLTGMFKKGSSSRTSSMERSDSTESRDRYTPSKDLLNTSVSDRPLQRPPSLINLSALGSSRGTTPLSSRATPSRSGMLRNQSSVETDV